jgi:thiamine-monophosphate kinase
MSLGEFDLIARYFTPAGYSADVLLGVGDDAAVLNVPAGFKLVAAVDTIVAGVHFPFDTNPRDIGYRALAVNLSDIAAMGAQPRWFTLSLCLPSISEAWLAEFASGLSDLAQQFKVQLVGGDTVQGPLNVSVQIMGCVEADRWLTRSGARVGDVIFVSGVPGEAAAGLQLIQQSAALQSLQIEPQHREHLLHRFLRPTPRVELGRALRAHASAAMDVSDGLLTDLKKLCAASRCGAQLELEALPRSTALHAPFNRAQFEQLALSGGDDYELLFTVHPADLLAVEAAMAECDVRCTPIGRVVEGATVSCCRNGHAVIVNDTGYDHFATHSGQR